MYCGTVRCCDWATGKVCGGLPYDTPMCVLGVTLLKVIVREGGTLVRVSYESLTEFVGEY